MNINLIFDIKQPTNQPLLSNAGKMITLFILIRLKSFSNPPLHLNFSSLNHSISTKITIMLVIAISPSLLYQIVEEFTLNSISSDFSFNFRFSKYLSLLFSYWLTPVISCNSVGSSLVPSLYLDPLINYI